MLLLVVPAQHLRALAERLAAVLPGARPLVICSKGIERGSGALMSEVLAEALPGFPLAVLSGPTFAAEVVRGLPCAMTLACGEESTGVVLLNALGTRHFRPYLSDDVIGVEVGGAVKNVIAIACGIVMGRGLGENARAALITRGLAEVVRLSQAKGGRPETGMGLSGLGDLTLTCCGPQSRNYSLGVALGEGRALADILAERHTVGRGRLHGRGGLGPGRPPRRRNADLRRGPCGAPPRQPTWAKPSPGCWRARSAASTREGDTRTHPNTSPAI